MENSREFEASNDSNTSETEDPDDPKMDDMDIFNETFPGITVGNSQEFGSSVIPEMDELKIPEPANSQVSLEIPFIDELSVLSHSEPIMSRYLMEAKHARPETNR